MNTLTYSPQTLGYTVNPSIGDIFIAKKVALIHDINTIQIVLGHDTMSTEQFYELLDSSLLTLSQMVNDQASLLSRIKERNLLY